MQNNMIFIAIKHKIYEICIDVIFRNIANNFPKKAYRIPSIGETYSSISYDKSDGSPK